MTPDEEKMLGLYRRLMIEVNGRLEAIQKLVNEETGFTARFAREICFLQLRMICETVALGCVIAHEGLSQLSTHRLKKEYAANRIVNELGRLHDRFYPQPIIMTARAPGRHHVVDNNLDHLTKADLARLYSKCGQVLHRGTPKIIIGGEPIDSNWIAEVMRYGQSIANLLGSHAIVMRGDMRALFCNLGSGEVMIADAI